MRAGIATINGKDFVLTVTNYAKSKKQPNPR